MDPQRASELLRAERERLQHLLDSRGDEEVVDAGDFDDAAEPLTAEATDDAIAASARERLDAIDRAEQRLAEGSYGRSVRSGLPIPDERLEADPAAELTVEEAAEAG